MLLSRVSPSVLKTIHIAFFLPDKATSLCQLKIPQMAHVTYKGNMSSCLLPGVRDLPGTSWGGHFSCPRPRAVGEPAAFPAGTPLVHSASRCTLQHTRKILHLCWQCGACLLPLPGVTNNICLYTNFQHAVFQIQNLARSLRQTPIFLMAVVFFFVFPMQYCCMYTHP